ncbi:MAG: protein kinase domain-containing protein [Myxococcaceae bacterium]
MAPLPLRYQPLGPVLAGEGSRAFLGLEVAQNGIARPIVLVWVPEDALGKPEVISQIRRETEHAATLDHPNILKVHGFASLEDGHARITEFADGESLRKILDTAGKLPFRLAARIAADAATGVHFAHLAGNDDGSPLIHGELRPETLLISFLGVTKVSGYGALSVAPKELSGKGVAGRRNHATPEQIIGGRSNILPQTDVFLIGLLLHECISGTVAFAADADADFERAVVTKPLPALPEAELPATLFKVIEKATAKKAQERYANPLELREAIQDAVGTLPAQADVAAFLNQHFPETHSSRTARRREIDAGIADLARSQWAAASTSSNGRPTPGATTHRTPTPPPPARPRAAAAPAPRPAPVQDNSSRPAPLTDSSELFKTEKPARRFIPFGIGAVVVIGLVLMIARPSRKPKELVKPAPAVTQPTPPPPSSAPPPPEEDPVAALPTPTPAAPSAPASAREISSLALDVDPDVEVSIAGQSYGQSPINIPLPSGKYLVQLVDKNKGINTNRTVVIRDGAKTTERVQLAKGFVTVSAPPGAQIFVDARPVGKAPLPRAVSLFEGRHQILVTVGKAKWQQAFSVRANEQLYFNVETQ